MKLETERLLLRDIVDADLDAVHKGLSDPAVIKHYGISFLTRAETRQQMKWYRDLQKSGTGIWWAIELKPDQQFIGAVGFNNLQKKHRKAEIGFWLYPEHWGKGYMQETIPPALEFAFSKLHLHRVEGYVESENEGSMKALEKLGFIHEGTMRDCEIKNGEFVDLHIYAMIHSEGNMGR